MELLQLKYFQVVAKMQHMTKAAKELNISQPSLSIMISRLETELGTLLFNRKARSIELNESGKMFLKRVNSIFSEIESAKLEIKEKIEINNNNISLAIGNTRFLFGILTEFLTKYPEVKLHQFLGNKDGMEESLMSGEIDFAMTSPPIEREEIQTIILREDEIVLVVPPNHRFATREKISLSEAKNENFISVVGTYTYRSFTDNLCNAAGFIPNIIFEVDDVLIYDMLHLGRGVALIPKSICEIYSNSPLKLIPIDEPVCNFTIGLSWSKNRYLTKTAESFKDFVIEYYKNR
ncbi:LysR family transcriptional regulator [Clostridium sp. SHJSY1]|uniref:LysR family transcriptional regulator n=1 Tax=Clostridium sp. SHJSY1 TaxID=2942483 RepID=UPI00287406CB|nr:LysR family transcriptional regulator [Clostridium sp. SHJSY1]MDS0524859.1 LysR family transcriptional regulator [Clostridium sp. SHJSY1]